VAQPAVVPSAPRVELPVGRDGGAVRAAARHVHHVLPRLLPVEGRDHRGLLQVPAAQRRSA